MISKEVRVVADYLVEFYAYPTSVAIITWTAKGIFRLSKKKSLGFDTNLSASDQTA